MGDPTDQMVMAGPLNMFRASVASLKQQLHDLGAAEGDV